MQIPGKFSFMSSSSDISQKKCYLTPTLFLYSGWGLAARRKMICVIQGTPLLAGLAIAAAALAGRYSIQAWQAFKARPPKPRMRKFYEGGFQQTMTRREAAQILGIRENATADKIKEAHRKVMVANHPDAGGSHYLASKINEAKDVMLGKGKNSGSPF
ncbi:mitochondrial import inner membrane translocase subunit TIM14-1-like isoform X1 [Malania oleifera]|uniref:mitochondrial import inner membrane translocase subunit TIM14-1-like isoform X1 n=2 Tax=Malania oleifera TaxID=397392 RepID=UPI0025ADE152|nr:mitochondrial import inner membrane translocase subunit TIM14-1-like isoform X1 [Malania oleifera]XP_057983789.1 mitochondrial import inner membrane translocase subunit TIM14-1-like isoform X1 [Malania oleifera]XP_057983790.1 mitochondrial import inner membrane translocase subunit TIM14-1-like isoform X1 [Malania oleifera]